MIFIIFWMIVFSLSHSILADSRLKRWVESTLGQRFRHGWYRLFYNIVSLITLLPLFLYMSQQATLLYTVPPWLRPVFIMIQLIGIVGLLVSILQIDWMRFAGLKQVLAYMQGGELPLPDEALVTTGLYAFVRHPLYLFSLLVLWFTPTMTNMSLIFNISATLYFVFGSLVEEQRMLTYYGEQYAQYQKNVPWLLPFIPTRG